MKNILKTIVILCLCIANAYAQQDTIPQRDSSHLAQTHKGIISRSANGNYINMDLPGIDLSGADFTPLDDTIAKLNLAGWDVKVIGYYGLSGSMDETVYEDLLSQIRVDKQVIVKIIIDGDIKKVDIELTNSQINENSNDLLKSMLIAYLQKNIYNLDANLIIQNLASTLGILLNPESYSIDAGEDNNGNRVNPQDLPKVLLEENGFYMTAFGIPLWLPKGTIASFWPYESCAISNGDCVPNTRKLTKGMLAYIQFSGSNATYISKYSKFNGEYLRGLRDEKNVAFSGISGADRTKIGDVVDVILGLPTNSECGSVKMVKVKHQVSKDYKYGTYQGDYVGIDELTFTIINGSEVNIITGEQIDTYINNARPYDLKADCPPSVKSIDLLNSIRANSTNWYAVVEIEDKFVANFTGKCYLVTFTTANGFLLYRSQNNTWYKAGANTNIWLECNVDHQYDFEINAFVKKKIFEVGFYETTRTVLFVGVGIVAGVATGGASIAVQLAVDVALAATEAGVVYLVEDDASKAVTTLITGGIGSGVGIGVGAAVSKVMSKVSGDVLETATEQGAKQIDEATKTTIKSARAATSMTKPVSDAVLKADFGWVRLSQVKNYARDVLKYSPEQLARLGDDIIKKAANGTQSLLLGCVNPISGVENDHIANSRFAPKKCFLKLRKLLYEIAESSEKKSWVNSDEFIENIEKRIDELNRGHEQDEEFLKQLKEFYKSPYNPKLPSDCNSSLPCIVTRIIDGVTYNVPFTKFGFPDFTEGIAAFEKNIYSGELTGAKKDLTDSAKWFVDNNDGAELVPNNPGKIIFNEKIYTMHHVEDGKTIIPILSELHNATMGGISHSGGKTLILNYKKLVDFFK